MNMFFKVLLLSTFVSLSVHATPIINASMKIWKPLLVDVTQNILMPSVLTTNHNQILSGDTSLIPGGVNGHNGTVRITGSPNDNVTITVPSSMNLSSGSDNITLTLTTINTPNTQTLDINGIADFTIAGTVSETLVDREEGNYSGISAAVTVEYQP